MLVDTSTQVAQFAIKTLTSQGEELQIALQSLVELWVVATRHVQQSGLGDGSIGRRWRASATQELVCTIAREFRDLSHLGTLVTQHQVTGNPTAPSEILRSFGGKQAERRVICPKSGDSENLKLVWGHTRCPEWGAIIQARWTEERSVFIRPSGDRVDMFIASSPELLQSALVQFLSLGSFGGRYFLFRKLCPRTVRKRRPNTCASIEYAPGPIKRRIDTTIGRAFSQDATSDPKAALVAAR